jgi:DNA polymerase III alpha subunit
MQPANIFDLAAVMTVVRPGPMRSGLTESYLRRRAGVEPVTYPDPRLEAFLGDTYGSMIYQEQVMATCMNLAGYDSHRG